jgi:hypothetical protein
VQQEQLQEDQHVELDHQEEDPRQEDQLEYEQQEGQPRQEDQLEYEINQYTVQQEKIQEEHHVQYEQQQEEHHGQLEQQGGQLIDLVDKQFQHLVQQNLSRKLPVVRAASNEKGKKIQDVSAHEGEDGDSSDSDYVDVHEEDSGDSSADDEEACCYRKQAQDLKNMLKRRMLGDEELKATKVPEEFIVPENFGEEEDASDCFDTEDELSYDEDSDGVVRTRRTKHRVYDENAEVKEFEVGQAFHDSTQFKKHLSIMD